MEQLELPGIPNRTAFYIRVDENEYKRVMSMCEATHCTPQQLFKKALLGRVNLEKPVYLMPPDEVREFKVALSRMGNNLNQIGKKVNAGLREGWEPVLHAVSRGLFDLNYKLGAKYASR